MKMPRFINTVVLILFYLILTSCSKNEEKNSNYFKYNDKNAIIGTAFADEMGPPFSGVNFTFINFLENTLIVKYKKSGIYTIVDTITGIGDLVQLNFVNADSSGLQSGKYAFSDSEEPFVTKTFGYESYLVIGFGKTREEGLTGLKVTGGDVTVIKDGDSYEINFSLKTDVNTTVSGFYKGVLKSSVNALKSNRVQYSASKFLSPINKRLINGSLIATP